MVSQSPLTASPQIQHGVRSPVPGTPITLRYQDVSELSTDDFDQLRALFTRAFNGGPSWFHLGVEPDDHLRWKAGPDRGAPTRIELTENESGIVGFRMTMWRRFLVHGEPTIVTEGVDATIDPSLQGRRITSQRADFSTSHNMRGQACFSLGYAMHPTSRLRRGVEGDAFASGEPLDTLVRPLSVRRFVERWRARRSDVANAQAASRTRAVMEASQRRLSPGLLAQRAKLGLQLGWALRPRLTRPQPWQIETIHRFDERADMFFESASEPFDLIQVRDAAYLNWRFCDPRAGRFIVRTVWNGETLLGYAALRAGPDSAILADLLTLPQELGVADALIQDAVRIARSLGAPSISTRMTRHHPYRALLAEAGFVVNPLPLTLSFAPVDCPAYSLEWLAEPGVRIHVMTADTDHV